MDFPPTAFLPPTRCLVGGRQRFFSLSPLKFFDYVPSHYACRTAYCVSTSSFLQWSTPFSFFPLPRPYHFSPSPFLSQGRMVVNPPLAGLHLFGLFKSLALFPGSSSFFPSPSNSPPSFPPKALPRIVHESCRRSNNVGAYSFLPPPPGLSSVHPDNIALPQSYLCIVKCPKIGPPLFTRVLFLSLDSPPPS